MEPLRIPSFQLPDNDTVFEVALRQESSLQREKKGNSRVDIKGSKIDTARTRNIPLHAKMVIDAEGTAIEIQYVPYAPTVFVNDYIDADGKLQKGLKSLGYDMQKEYEKACRRPLVFDKAGFLFLNKFGGDKNLLYFLMAHESNEDSLYRPKGGLLNFLNFKLVKPREVQKKVMDNINVKMDVIKWIGTLYERTDAGIYKYDEMRIGAIAKILQIDGQFANVMDRYEYIVRYAAQPALFKERIDKAINAVKIDLGKAVAYQLATVSKKDAKAIKSGKNEIFYTFKYEGVEAMEELAYWVLGTKEGQSFYLSLYNDIVTAEVAAASPLKK